MFILNRALFGAGIYNKDCSIFKVTYNKFWENYGNTPNLDKVYTNLSGGAALYIWLSKILTIESTFYMNYLCSNRADIGPGIYAEFF